MARTTKPRGKIVRKFGENIFDQPKFDKVLARKPFKPGIHGKKRASRPSDYGTQLKEKQKLKAIYDLTERQFRQYFNKARKTQAATGEKLIQLLESRLDNLVFRAGFVPSRASARQLVSHGHVLVNDKKINIPSCLVRIGQVISLSPKGQKHPLVVQTLQNKDITVPKWLKRKAAVAKFERLPERDEVGLNIQEQLIVEFYSR